jgi:multimeric flavodoxin WrbA
MDRRDFLKKSALGIAALAATSLLENPVMAKANELINSKTDNSMKKIMVIDGGPRKNMNTAAMVQAFVEGAQEGGADVKVVRLYDIDYKGCRSCMACQLKDKRVPSCRFKDGITDILAECAEADGLVLASPIYYGEVTAQLRAFYERLTFPWLSYKDFSIVAPKKMPVTMIYTMNASPEQAPGTLQNMKGVEAVLGMSFGNTPEVIMANNTKQVNDYSRYDFSEQMAQSHDKWHEEHFAEELQRAREAGKRMATGE